MEKNSCIISSNSLENSSTSTSFCAGGNPHLIKINGVDFAVVLLDTETCNLFPPPNGGPVTIALKNWKENKIFSTDINLQSVGISDKIDYRNANVRQFHAASINIHGKRPEMLYNCPSLPTVLEQLFTTITNNGVNGIVFIAKNCSFDKRIMEWTKRLFKEGEKIEQICFWVDMLKVIEFGVGKHVFNPVNRSIFPNGLQDKKLSTIFDAMYSVEERRQIGSPHNASVDW